MDERNVIGPPPDNKQDKKNKLWFILIPVFLLIICLVIILIIFIPMMNKAGSKGDTLVSTSTEDGKKTDEGTESALQAESSPTEEPGNIKDSKKEEETISATEPPVEKDVSKESSDRIHIVKRGECLTSIAILYYKSGQDWKKIYIRNKDNIKNPHLIYPDQKLIIP